MPNHIYDSGYGICWTDFYVQSRQAYVTSVSDFHKHEFYEINLILSGNVKILLADQTEQGTQNRIVLTRPNTPHYISCNSDTLYSRLYLLFSKEFLEDYVPEWKKLQRVFGKNGRILNISEEQKEFCKSVIQQLQSENDRLRQKLCILYLLSYLGEWVQEKEPTTEEMPPFVMEALTYMEEHYDEKIIASKLAKKLHVSRTTLMTAFKEHTGNTLNQYLNRCRLKHAIAFLRQGKTEYEVAELCGWTDSCGLIRSFRRQFAMTPRQYLLQQDK